jgi:uncharacterized protein YndB with AHSA1/START domain
LEKGNKTIIKVEPEKQELFISREFDAPREIVFEAFIDPKLYKQWIGPRDLSMNLETFEPRNGGMWRYIQQDKNGNKYGFHGVFHEVAKPERIINTFEFEGLPEKGHAILEIAKFEELPNNRTRLIAQNIFQSVLDRDGMLQSGMEKGVSDSYDRLDELLKRNLK